MTLKHILCVALMTASLSATANADTFSVKLGKKTLGTLSYDSASAGETLTTQLGSTPMGVFNGSFKATSNRASGLQKFSSVSASSRKTRTIRISLKNGRAVDTTIEPAAEMTPLSNPARVPSGVIDPVQAIGKLLSAGGCPDTITIYDGRRAIALRAGDMAVDGETQTCAAAYRVIAGPGHLSPLKISKAKMKLTYVGADKARKLTRIDLGSGVFNLVLERTD